MSETSPAPTEAQPTVAEVSVPGARYRMVLPDAATDYIQGLIQREGKPYEPEMLEDIQRRVQPDDLVLDIGANIGNHSLYLACVAHCHVEAFEPNLHLCEAMRASAALNGLGERLRVHAIGIGREATQASFDTLRPDNLGAQALKVGDGAITVVPLDSLQFSRPVRVLKVDVEGMEAAVLDGATATLQRDRPIVYVECMLERDFRDVTRRLERLGYCCWDTFNATPTHLFLPIESIGLDLRLGRMQAKQVQDEYRLGVLTKDVRQRLVQAQERDAQLRKSLAKAEQGIALRDQTIERQQRERTELSSRIVELQKQLASTEQQARTQETGLRRALDERTARLSSAERSAAAAADRLEHVRASTSFRLGAALLSARSPGALLRLPKRLWQLFRDSRQRRDPGARKASVVAAGAHRIDPASLPALPRMAVRPAGPPPPLLAAEAAADPRQLRLALLADAALQSALAPECAMIAVDATGWSEALAAARPQCLLVTSDALAPGGVWTAADGGLSRAGEALLAGCAASQLPTALWITQGIADASLLLPWARRVHHVFVAELGDILRLSEALGHPRVHLLPRALQPRSHHPAGAALPAPVSLPAHQPQAATDVAAAALQALASNAVVVSPYARALRLLFGDLVVSSDNAGERERRVALRLADAATDRALRLRALRKLLAEHTLADRLALVAERLAGPVAATETARRRVAVLVIVQDAGQAAAAQHAFSRQTLAGATLLLVGPPALPIDAAAGVQLLASQQDAAAALAGFTHVAPWSTRDHHGPDGLGDLVLGLKFGLAEGVTRRAHFARGGDGAITLQGDGAQYRVAEGAELRASLLPAQWLIPALAAGTLDIDGGVVEPQPLLAIDEFNYVRDGLLPGAALDTVLVDAAVQVRTGVSMERLQALADRLAAPPAGASPAPVAMDASGWFGLLQRPRSGVETRLEDDRVLLRSTLEGSDHQYLYLQRALLPQELGDGDDRLCWIDGEARLNLMFVLAFFDAAGTKLSHAMHAVGARVPLVLPPGTASVKVALRVQGAGEARLGTMVLAAPRPSPLPAVSDATQLVVAKQYPDYADLYRNGFVHARVRAYAKAGERVDVLRVTAAPGLRQREFENVDVTEADLSWLDDALSRGAYAGVLVHFLDPAIWKVLRRHVDRVRITVWAHGVDIQPWWRRWRNHDTDAQRDKARAVGDERLAMWRELFALRHPNLRVVFVSRKQADEALTDLRVDDDAGTAQVIHNFIDGELFAYQPKPPELRKRVLSIRPFASAVYANDLTVQAILLLSSRPFFGELQFRIVGDGPLFDATVAPLRGLRNVVLSKGFLSQREIAALHREYGVFLVPSRMDSQGVSRDEAMASGLVPVTTRVAAIPEFVDAGCAFLAEPEDAAGLAAAIEALFHDPERFVAMSEAAAQRVRAQSGVAQTIRREIDLIRRVEAPAAPDAGIAQRLPQRIAVYGDLNLNVMDGSAIWAASLAEVLAGLPRTQVTLLLKARILRTPVIARLIDLAPAVQLVEPELPLQASLDVDAALDQLELLDAQRRFRAFVLRGLELCTRASARPALQGRFWAYLTDVPQSADAMDAGTREQLATVIAHCEHLLCQTPQMEAYLCSLFPQARGKTRQLPPMVPPAAEAATSAPGDGPLRLCYAGKFAPDWGIRELLAAFAALREVAPDAELHVFGDKIHNPKDDPDYRGEIARALSETPGLQWHGAVDRDTLMRSLATMDLCWAWRAPALEQGTHELSTKLLEFASLGVPMIVTRSPVNASVLGADYPLFVDAAGEATSLLCRLAADRSLLDRARPRLRAVAASYGFEAVRRFIVEQGLLGKA